MALSAAAEAASAGEVPVGAVIWRDGSVIADSRNETEASKDPTAHAEVLAIRRAAAKLKNWRLEGCVLCVTLEPCTMCAGAIRLARIPTVVYGAYDPGMGAFGSLYDLSEDRRLGPVPRVISGVKESDCSGILKRFFESCR
jgi:tRNA(adenine34) deaminase